MSSYKLLENNSGESSDDLGYVIDELYFFKIKNFCPVKDSIKRMRRQGTDWEKIFAEDT